MAAMDRSVAWRAALLQLVMVAVIAVVLGAVADDGFFEDWGWLAGPGVWGACALVCAAVLRLPALPVLAGAALSGLPSVAAVLAGVHWAGTPLALVLFGAWCGWIAARAPARAQRDQDRGTARHDGGTALHDRGTAPDDRGTAPDDRGTAPDDRGAATADRGTAGHDSLASG
jgi:hypothetical protein